MEINDINDSEIFSFPGQDESIRYFLGRKGSKNILCIGVNPNTADEEKLDATSRNVEKIARLNGFDGWVLANLYPRRMKSVSMLEMEPDKELMEKNLNLIGAFMQREQFEIDTVWLAWGDDIDSFNHHYLRDCAYLLYTKLGFYDLNYVVVGVNQSGNPTHPNPQGLASKYRGDESKLELRKFNFKSYISPFKLHYERKNRS